MTDGFLAWTRSSIDDDSAPAAVLVESLAVASRPSIVDLRPMDPVAQLIVDGTTYIQRMAAVLPVDREADARFAALKVELAHRIPKRVLWKP